MPYMLLIVEPLEQRSARTETAGRELYADMMRYVGELQARGVLVAAESLESSKKGKRLEVRGGQTRLTDGPFAEAKEMVGGFFLLDCDTEAEAIEIAERCPAAQWCTIEVRKTGPCYL